MKLDTSIIDHKDTSNATGTETKVGYLPFVSLLFDKAGDVRYRPVSWQDGFLDLSISVVRSRRRDGGPGSLYIQLNIDDERNKITNRAEIIDI